MSGLVSHLPNKKIQFTGLRPAADLERWTEQQELPQPNTE
jgi:hypothetical protein